jgi:hypothetical protein
MTLSLWAQSNLFNKDALAAILTSSIHAVGNRGKTSFTLVELLNTATLTHRGNASRFVLDAVPREHKTRWDITLSSKWVEEMIKINSAFAYAVELADGVRKHMGGPACKKANIVWHAQIVHPNSPNQALHMDDDVKHKRRYYYTLIIPLTNDHQAGGTFVPLLNKTFASFGGAIVFDGAVEHAGMGNKTNNDRIFLYAAIFTGYDRN